MAKDGTNRGGARPGAGRKKKTPEGTYEHVTFTAEQLKELTDSPYVAYVSSKTVSYTKAFKATPHNSRAQIAPPKISSN